MSEQKLIEVVDNSKKAWHSKTLWIALINAAVAFVPPVQKVLAENMEAYMIGLSMVFAVLRKLTKGKVDIV